MLFIPQEKAAKLRERVSGWVVTSLFGIFLFFIILIEPVNGGVCSSCPSLHALCESGCLINYVELKSVLECVTLLMIHRCIANVRVFSLKFQYCDDPLYVRKSEFCIEEALPSLFGLNFELNSDSEND